MVTTRALYLGAAAVALALMSSPAQLCAQQAAAAVSIDNDDIGGVVTGANGPEAGVWVIAETTDLPTRFTKSVVTDDQGRYVIPDLPNGNYQVWVRGYGLVDSPRLRTKPGQQLNHTAIKAPDERSAAHYYPAIYWFTMMKIPPAADFGGHTDIPKNITREVWLQRMNNVDCVGCHQLGQEATRTIPAQFGKFDFRRRGVDTSHRVGSVRRDDDKPARRSARRRAVQVPRRLDRRHRERRPAEAQAAAAFGHRAQSRGDDVGLVDAGQVSPRPDLVRPAQADGERRWPALRRAGVFDRQHADPRSEDAQGVVLQDAGGRSQHASLARTGARRRRQADDALGILG